MQKKSFFNDKTDVASLWPAKMHNWKLFDAFFGLDSYLLKVFSIIHQVFSHATKQTIQSKNRYNVQLTNEIVKVITLFS